MQGFYIRLHLFSLGVPKNWQLKVYLTCLVRFCISISINNISIQLLRRKPTASSLLYFHTCWILDYTWCFLEYSSKRSSGYIDKTFFTSISIRPDLSSENKPVPISAFCIHKILKQVGSHLPHIGGCSVSVLPYRNVLVFAVTQPQGFLIDAHKSY